MVESFNLTCYIMTVFVMHFIATFAAIIIYQR